MVDAEQVKSDAEKAVSEVEQPSKKKAEKEPKKKGRPRKFSKIFINLKGWSSYDDVSSSAKTTVGLFRRLLRRKKDIRNETYEEAIARMGLTEEQVEQRKKSFLQSSFVYALFALGFLVYFLYLIFNVRLLAASLTLLLVIVMSLATYKDHFWYMQMQKKKLGCSFQDWLDFVLGRPAK